MNTLEREAEISRVDQALHPRPRYRNGNFRSALGCMLLIPALAYVLTFVIASIPSIGLRHIGISKFGPVLDYGFEATNVNADVLIFGDSSAFLGIDPRVVKADLGATTAVIPNTIGSLPATGDIPLEKYLAHNKQPKLLVLYFSPWNMNYDHAKQTEFLFEGEEELLRYGSWKDILLFAVHRPLHILSFPLQAYRLLGVHNLSIAAHHPDREQRDLSVKAYGHLDYVLPYPKLHEPCRLRDKYVTDADDRSVQDLLQRYGTKMRVVVYLAPIPGCQGAERTSQRAFTDLKTSPPNVLPAQWFADDGFYAHVRPEHVTQNSHLFSHAIQQKWASSSVQ